MSDEKHGKKKKKKKKKGNGAADLTELSRTIWLAGLGALAEVEGGRRAFFDDLVERGRRVERDQMKTVDRVVARTSERAEHLGEEVRQRLKGGVEEVLHRANLPSRDDLKALAARLDRLAERIEAAEGPGDPARRKPS